jgi:hypothetical protein
MPKITIKLIHLDNNKDPNNIRQFTALIDGRLIEGRLQLLMGRSGYRMKWPKGYDITKHPDYIHIRRDLLSQMIDSNDLLLSKKVAIK